MTKIRICDTMVDEANGNIRVFYISPFTKGGDFMEKNRVLPIRNLLQLSSKRSGEGLQPYRLSVIVITVAFGLR